MFESFRSSSIDWRPSPVVALATSADDSQVAAAREDGSLELWLVSPGSVGWHCQLTIHGDPKSRVSSLVWCQAAGSKELPCGRLLSSSIDGSVSEWDFFLLKQKTLLETIGVSIWQMAAAPPTSDSNPAKPLGIKNGYSSRWAVENGYSDSESESDSDLDEINGLLEVKSTQVALACDDGCVRIYNVEKDDFVYSRSMPRVSGRILSVAWSTDASLLFSGSSDGLIRSWNPKLGQEIYRITVGIGGSESIPDLCVWSLLSLSSGTLVSADSTGTVQFWDSKHGTLLQAHSYHKGDVNSLAAAPGHNRVYSAGSDGQVILYKLSNETLQSTDGESGVIKKWTYVGYVRAHSHDVRALTVAVPIIQEDVVPKEKRMRIRKKPIEFSYHKWAHLGVPMLISAGDDSKLYAYSAKEFTQFSPHDICPAPQRPPIQLVPNSAFNKVPLILVQAACSLDIMCVQTGNGTLLNSVSGSGVTNLVARVKSKASRRIICSTISSSGELFAYSDHAKPSLFALKCKSSKNAWGVDKRPLPHKLPYAHAMVFSFDSSRLMIAGHDRKIYVVDVNSAEIKHVFTPCIELLDEKLPPTQPPITKLFTSSDGQWLAAINCFGDLYIFNLETLRQHWFVSRLDGASVTAGGFPPQNNNVLVLTTSSNQVYVLDVEEKKMGDWSRSHSHALPKRFQEFPGEVIGLSFPPSNSSSVIVYSARELCRIDFGMPVGLEEEGGLNEAASVGGKRKYKKDYKIILGRKNFDFHHFPDPILFIGHLSDSSFFIMDKPWIDVVKNFEAQPVHRLIFGT